MLVLLMKEDAIYFIQLSRMAGLLDVCKEKISTSVQHVTSVETECQTLRQLLKQVFHCRTFDAGFVLFYFVSFDADASVTL
jgi:hypothetical protein